MPFCALSSALVSISVACATRARHPDVVRRSRLVDARKYSRGTLKEMCQFLNRFLLDLGLERCLWTVTERKTNVEW